MKRSTLHNIKIDISNKKCKKAICEGLAIPRKMLKDADIMPFEQINITKIGSNNWNNRMYTFAIPNDENKVEARGSIAYFLEEGDITCVITSTLMDDRQLSSHNSGASNMPIIDVRYFPDNDIFTNNINTIKILLEYGPNSKRVENIDTLVLEERRVLPRVMLSNLLLGVQVEVVETKGCLEMSAELPLELMKKAKFSKNQSITTLLKEECLLKVMWSQVKLRKKWLYLEPCALLLVWVILLLKQAYMVTNNPVKPVIHNNILNPIKI